ncbi:hypothetical protein [Pseudonocardia sp. TRM90224]|uniref:hypothetical protein n=1 Tax=Pseudonocardia sp. TRM90224 TaxID=2812678 RepID=UPI001E5750F0|nr:hypothetical protein [Pseudonocardia sp. TRM90224]
MSDLVPTGSPTTNLIIIRWNSGSGKSTVAGAVRAERGRPCALAQQDTSAGS